MSAAIASRAVSGATSCQRLRSVAMTDVLRYWLVTTVWSGIQAEIAMAGTRTPDLSKPKFSWPGAEAGCGGGADRRRHVVVGAAVLVEGDDEQRVPGVGARADDADRTAL